MSSNLVPSFRFPGVIADPSVPKAVSDVMQLHSNALTDIYQAIPLLKEQIEAVKAGQATTTVINNGSGGGGGGGTTFSGLGSVRDLRGDVSYTNQPSDNGALLIFGDASPVAVQLTSGVTSPYLLFAQNWDAGVVTFTPSSGTISYIGNSGVASMPLAEGYSTLLIFDGVDWFAETLPVVPDTFAPVTGEFLTGYSAPNFSASALPIATDSTPGIVEVDGVTIGISGGVISTIGATGTILLGPLTDSGATGHINVSDGIIISFVNPT